MQGLLSFRCSSQSPPPTSIPLSICNLSAELSSRTSLTLGELDAGSPLQTDVTASFSFVCSTAWTSHHLLLWSHRVNKCSTTPLELIFANWFSILEEKLTCFLGIGNFPPETSCCVHRQNQTNGTTAYLSCSLWQGNSVYSLQTWPRLCCSHCARAPRPLPTLPEASPDTGCVERALWWLAGHQKPSPFLWTS